MVIGKNSIKNPPTEVGGFYQGGARREKEKKGESTAEEESMVKTVIPGSVQMRVHSYVT